jgi:hypothetical protein
MSSSTPGVDPLFLSFQLALAGRYSIDRELGRGGMGIVYLAREVHLDRPVAIKLLPPQRASQPTLRERFLREARLAAKLSHPNIIPIHAVDDVGGFVFYVMAFVDGETLANRVRTRGPLPSAEGTRVLREVAWALAYAHAQGLVHRDVKPDNILLESSSGRVLVADFGIAAVLSEASGDGISGTPEVMSPEQALGKPLDGRSDLYGLGATAYYAFAGRFPFEGKSPTEVLAKQVTEHAAPLASLGSPVPRKLAALVDRCLAKEPEHRPESAQALAEQLSVALEQRRELPAALRAFVKRNGRLNGGGSLIVIPLLLPASVVTSMMFGDVAGFATFVLGLTALPFGYLIGRAKRLAMQGFAHADLEPAFKQEMEQAREELSSEGRVAASLLEPVLLLTARVSAVLTIGAFGAMVVLSGRDMFRIVVQGFSVFMPVALVATFGWLTLAQRHRDLDSEFWLKFWKGRLGRFAFRIADKLLVGKQRQSVMTHRATELSLGMAAEQLFESLPKQTRQEIGDLPSILRRLQDDAQALRQRYDSLQEALKDAGDAATGSEYADVRSMRDQVRAKLSETVGALETIRLNLLRLHAGSTSVHGVTTHLGIAAEVSEQVERLIAAHEEVERSINFPRMTEATPV